MTLSLHNAQLRIERSWGTALPDDIKAVVNSMRFVSLNGLKLRSDRQPRRLLIENIQSQTGQWAPMVVACDRPHQEAWIRVTIDGMHWARLAYQFGHELGHVLCNSWGYGAVPQAPCQWIEEVCVEAFSIRGLFEMGRRWAQRPPYPSWKAYAPHLIDYAETTLRSHRRLAKSAGVISTASMSFSYKSKLDNLLKLGPHAKALVPMAVNAFRHKPNLAADLGGLNRWHGKASEPTDSYLKLWQESCLDLGLSGELPMIVRDFLTKGVTEVLETI